MLLMKMLIEYQRQLWMLIKMEKLMKLILLYTEFISALSQELKVIKLLPITIDNTKY